jgi:hypothetical protein
MLHAWFEHEATWERASAAVSWQTAGANSSSIGRRLMLVIMYR